MEKFILKTDTSRCVGHAQCEAVAGDLIELDDNGMNVTPEREVSAGDEALARRAARACPEGIITVVKA